MASGSPFPWELRPDGLCRPISMGAFVLDGLGKPISMGAFVLECLWRSISMGAFVLDGFRRPISKLSFLRIVFFRIELQYSHNSPVPITAS